ncbi:MAG: Gfo/Idh/MocA family oxidoreductase [Chthonomonadales bacterium]|nr:Gfo/Idh/MocA family oxidoreductase [Chthonomonadales bacterium]
MRVTYNHEYPRRIRAAMIGCGGHAQRNILPAFQYAPIDLCAACDLDAGRARAVGGLFGARAFYADYREMLAREAPEAVFVVTSFDERGRPRYPRIATDAMHAGADAWIEKPPAVSSDEIRALAEASRSTGRIVGVGFKKAFAPAAVKAREIAMRAEFGPISTLSARYPQSLPAPGARGDPRALLGFLDHIVHPASVLVALAGPVAALWVERCAATGGAVAALRFRSGAAGALHLSAGQSGMAPLERLEVVGQGASLVVDNNIRLTYYRPGAPRAGYGREGTFYGEDASAPLCWEPEFSLGQLYNKALFLLGYVPEILEFCAGVLERRAPSPGGLDDALEVMKLYEAFVRSDGQLVETTDG